MRVNSLIVDFSKPERAVTMQKNIFVFVVGLILSQSAAAAVVTFDFTVSNQTYTNGSYVFTGSDNTSTVSVSGGNQGHNYTSYISGSQWGLLLCTGGAPSSPRSSSSCGSGTNDVHYIDGGSNNNGSDPDEYVSLDFGGDVTVKQATFYRSSRGDFDLYADGVRILNEERVSNTVEFTAGEHGSVFAFLADGSSDQFKLTSLTVEVSQVPLPAAAWLFGSALLGLGSVARRKKA